MALNAFERVILSELRLVTGNLNLKEADMKEWRSRKITPQDGEEVVKLSGTKVWVAIPKQTPTGGKPRMVRKSKRKS